MLRNDWYIMQIPIAVERKKKNNPKKSNLKFVFFIGIQSEADELNLDPRLLENGRILVFFFFCCG